MSERKFKSLSLGKPLYLAISDFIKQNPEYKSVADFVSEAARLRIQDLERLNVELAQLQLSRRNERGDKRSEE